MSIEKKPFGKTSDGKETDLYTLTNANGLKALVTNYGGIVTSLLAPDRNRLTGAAVAPLRASCRHLQTIFADQLEAVFADKLPTRRKET